MNHRSTALVAVAALGLSRVASAQAPAAQAPSACSGLGEHAHDTVIVFQPPTSFSICRNGSRQDDVVTGRPVYLEVTPTPGTRMFDFRVHGQSSEWTPTGLGAWWEQAQRIATGLQELEQSGEPISSLVVPADGAPAPAASLRPLAAARARYLGVVTPHYLEILQGVRTEARDLPVIAGVVKRWCSELSAQAASSPLASELQARCAGVELKDGEMERGVQTLETAAKAFEAKRVQARDVALGATAHPEDAAGVADGVRALDEARQVAVATVASARPLRDASRALAEDIAVLRSVIGSIDALRPGSPAYLSTYQAPGNAELEIDVRPIDIGAAGAGAQEQTSGKTTLRFPIAGRHYFDLEAGVGITAGLPQIPTVGTQGGAATIQGKPVDEFVGLALAELEPARFIWPDLPAAGLLRLPVIGIPFTRDPTQNFFVGGGIGWTGVGSIVAGPYLLRELSLRDGYELGQVLPTGTSLDAATEPSLQVGYFVSASLDLVGLFHLFFREHPASIDAATGKEK